MNLIGCFDSRLKNRMAVDKKEELSLAGTFEKACLWYEELENESRETRDPKVQNKIHETLSLFEKSQGIIRCESIYSTNEGFDEMTIEQLKYILADYYLGALIQKLMTESPTERLKVLGQADAYYSSFLNRCESYHILKADARKAHFSQLEDKMDPQSLRECKMARFKLERQAKSKLNLLKVKNIQDEDTQREMTLILLELAIIHTFNDQLAIRDESGMLKQFTKEPFNTRMPPPPVESNGIEVTHFNATMEMTRETIRSQVFQPGYRQPTMSLDEYAERELQDAMERQEREKNAPEPPKRMDQLEEEGLEDDEALVEDAVYRDRAWDAWKDANPKGSGNKKWSQF